ncbi:MAG: ABC transporter permease [Vicinamibacterales bacterium]
MSAGLVADLHHAVRSLARRPGFSALVILTLGLGTGANAAIFSAVDSLLLRQPPFTNPDELVRITAVRGAEGGGTLSTPELDDLLALPQIADAAMYTDQGMYNASGFGTPEELPATITTHNLFRVLGVEPLVGSTFPAVLDRSRGFGLVISHGLWVRKFGRDPNVVGRTMTLDGAPGYTIHGVMPEGFNFPSHSDLFRSSGISANPDYYRNRAMRDRFVLARLRPGVAVGEATAAIDTLARRLEREFPVTNAGVRYQVTPLREMYSGQVRPYVLLLFAAVTLVLAVACVNVANLLLSRAIARERETAVRAALGASRWRLVRPLLAESLVYATLGAGVGAVLAVGGTRLLTRLVPVQLPPWMAVEADWRVGLFLVAITLVTAVAATAIPALRASAAGPHASLKEGTRGSSSGRGQRAVRAALVAAEMALALVLLVGASLLLQSVWRLHTVDLGYRTDSTLTFRVELGWAAYGTVEKTLAFNREMVDRLRTLPDVVGVTYDTNLPISGKPRDPYAIRAAGQSTDEAAANPFVHGHLIGPDYFAVMGIPIVRGRAVDDRDRLDTEPTVVVSERLAERLWPGRDPIGQRLQELDTARPEAWRVVVGVAAPVLHHELDAEPGFDAYMPAAQERTNGPYFVVRTAGDPMTVAAAATRFVGAIDPNQSFLDVLSYDTRVANRIWQRRLAGVLFGAFAVLAIALAAVGLYGVMSYVIGQQTREMGVRLALGATEGGVVRHVLTHGLTMAAAGAVAGLVLAAGLARLMRGVLFGVGAGDPLTFVAVPCVLLAIAALACYGPARRASRVDPVVALRAE